MTPPKHVQDIAVHFDHAMGYPKVNSILVDGHYLPVQSITIVEGAEPPGYITIKISMSRVRFVQDWSSEDDECD